MKNNAIGALAFLVSCSLLIGCSNQTTAKGNENHEGHKNHVKQENQQRHENHDSDEGLGTKNQQEVMQKDINHNLQKWNDEKVYGKNIKIAVLDTGIDKNNSDLSYIKGANFTSDKIDEFADDNGHGTKIAGIIGARKNNHTLLGIAPESDLYIAKVANGNGDAKFENLVKGVYWAIEQNVDIINISLEFPNENNELHEAIKKASEKNIIVVSSSGNIKHEGDSDKAYPGAYPEVVGVGMLNVKGKMYSKEFEKKKVDVFAPGEDIYSLYFNSKMTLDTGVSFATAYTSGYSALLIQKHKDNNTDYNKKQIISELKKDLEKKI